MHVHVRTHTHTYTYTRHKPMHLSECLNPDINKPYIYCLILYIQSYAKI